MSDFMDSVSEQPVQDSPEQPAKAKRGRKPKAEAELYPVRLLKDYRPSGEFKVAAPKFEDDPESEVIEREPLGEQEILDERGRIKVVATGEYAKCIGLKRDYVQGEDGKKRLEDIPGQTILLEKDEANRLLKLGLAERAFVAY